MSTKSFYELDYIIEINERRLEQYNTAYDKVLTRFTNIILIYSTLSLFLIPIIQDFVSGTITSLFFRVCCVLFIISLIVSIIFTIRLIIPIQIAYLTFPKRYYEEYRMQYEQANPDTQEVSRLLKSSYINELEKSLTISVSVFRRKTAFYYWALIWALLATIPYLTCIGFHLSIKDDKVQKVQIITTGK